MEKIVEFLKGKKSFFVAALLVVVAGLKATGYLTDAQYEVVMGILGALGIGALRLAIAKK